MIRLSDPDAERLFEELREKLSPQGNVVSAAGRQRTMELFGEPLTPQQVVERICAEVKSGGLKTVLEYTAKLDRKEIDPESFRVSAAELEEAHQKVDPTYLKTI
ncbi:MAG TPA: histidinol dehydrogenase, partial [Planctomycetaceae bacterium]|nr:histidinol dehydrogenase [Planctomycetaceae bacterium]